MFNNEKMLKEKKSETLEIRLSYAKKNAFMAQCAKDNETASHVLRRFIETYVVRAHDKTSKKPLFSAVQSDRLKLAFLALIMVVGTSVTKPNTPHSPEHNIIFSRMDTNQDGYLTASDAKNETRSALFALLEHTDKNDDGKLSTQEIDQLPIVSMKQYAGIDTVKPDTTTTKFVSFELAGDISAQAIKNQLQGRRELASFDADALQALAQKISQHARPK